MTFLAYRLKALIKERNLVFWALIFPIILVSVFQLVFSGLSTANLFEPFAVGIVDERDRALADGEPADRALADGEPANLGLADDELVAQMTSVEIDGEKVFKLKYVSEEDGRKLLAEKKIAGLVRWGVRSEAHDLASSQLELAKPILEITEDGANQMLLAQFLNSYVHAQDLVLDIIGLDPDALSSPDFAGRLDFTKTRVKELPVSERSASGLALSFYSAIAMACLYGACLALYSSQSLLANMSAAGMRAEISPMKKSKLIACDFAACLIVELLMLFILLLYLKYGLGIALGGTLAEVGLIAITGVLFASSFGYLLSVVFAKRQAVKMSLLISLTMAWSFLAGMMSPYVKHQIDLAIPWLRYLNPVALITDSFYSLFYYGDFAMVLPLMGVLAGMCAICLVCAMWLLRRHTYESL